MTDLADLAARIVTGDVEVLDLTSPLPIVDGSGSPGRVQVLVAR